MKTICSIVGVSKSSYYNWRKQAAIKKAYEQAVVANVKEIRKDKPSYGFRKVLIVIRERGISIGRDKLISIMHKYDLMLKRNLKKHQTTFSEYRNEAWHNLIKNQVFTAPNQAWATDITYLNTVDGVAYLSVIMDLYSRKIIAYSLSTDLTTNSSLVCLKRAIKSVGSAKDIIHHSDHGSQYCSHLYRHILNKNGLIPSYTGKDHCYDNAKIERFFNTLKHEYGLKT